MPNILVNQYRTWGDALARDTLAGEDPNEGAAKIAEEYGLNDAQVDRLCEAANIRAHELGMKGRGPKDDVRFKLAEAPRVRSMMGDQQKTASDDFSDYDSPPVLEPAVRRSVNSILADTFAGEEATMADLEKRAELESLPPEDERPLTQAEVYNLLHQMQKAAKELELERYEIERMSGEHKRAFIEMVRRMVHDDGYRIEDLYKASTMARPDKRDALRELFADAFSKLAWEGVIETGEDPLEKSAEPLDPELISKHLDELLPDGFKIIEINGEHPLLYSIDGVIEAAQQRAENLQGKAIMDQKVDRAKLVLTSLRGA